MCYALLVRCDENALVSPEERAARGKAFASFAEEQCALGVLLADHRLLAGVYDEGSSPAPVR
jgi:hypothetical protein